MNYNQRVRSRIILVLVILVALGLGLSLFNIQIIKGDYYASRANTQYAKPAKTLFDRGSIYFSNKDNIKIAAAAVARGWVVYINPSIINDPEVAYKALSQYLDLEHDEFIRKATKVNDRYEELANQVTSEVADSIKSLGLTGVGVSAETWRRYPGGNLASHELGILGQSASSSLVSGRYGLERSYEDVLSREGFGSSINSFARLFSGLRDSVLGEKSEADIITTIEPSAQRYLEKVLAETRATWQSDEIGGIVIRPENGEVIAMSSLPSFDPNDTSSVRDIRVFSNPLVESVYEMGSIMKPLTMAVALDDGVVDHDSTYDDTGTMTLSGKKISNFDGRARGVVPVQEILSQSLNVGAAKMALLVGKDNFAKYFLDFGLGERTGIDLPNEAIGLVGNLKTGRDVEIATVAYGQGIAISPVAMARALCLLANGGRMITPHLVKEIDYADGRKEVLSFTDKTVIKKETADEVTKMLVKVVDDALAKGAIKMDRYQIAAKTGTAQIPDNKNGGYYKDRYLHSFFGYFPASRPEFLVFIYQVYPKGAEYASATMTKPFDQIAKFLIDYYGLSPDR